MPDTVQGGISRSPWIAILGCGVVMTVVLGLTMVGLGVIVPQWMAELSLSGGQAMLVMTAISLLSGLGGIGVGVLIGRFPAWMLLFAGVLSGGLALLLAAQAQGFGALLLAIVPLGALGNALTGPVVGQAIAVRRMAHPGFAIAIVSMGMSVASILGPILTAGLLAQTDWRDAMRIAALIIIVVGGAAALLMVRGEPGGRPAIVARSAGTQADPIESGSGLSLSEISGSSTFLGAALFQFPLMSLMSAAFFNLVLIYGETGGSVTAAAAMMSIAAAAGLAGTLVTGGLLDRIPHVLVAAAVVVLMGGGHLILAFSANAAMLPAAVLLISLGNSALLPLVPALLAARFKGDDFQKANGLFQPMLFGSILGALAAGVLHDVTGQYGMTFRWLLVLHVPVLIGFGLIARTSRSGRVDHG